MAAITVLPSTMDALIHGLRRSGLVLMGVRDARTRRGKVFKGSNGVSRPGPSNKSGWWHRVRSLADIPVPGLGQAPPPSAARKGSAAAAKKA